MTMNNNVVPKPEGSQWTDDQWSAIVRGGENILVAAAAGSGKTAVLVERIIRKIASEEEPLNVDQLLVATFTKAAAAEMRERIREALEKELDKNPDSEHLRRQLALMNRASITTLHSFCLEVIQRYFQLIPLDPAFRIANETEADFIRQEVLEDLFEAHYAEDAEDSDFRKLVDWFSGERSDEAMVRLVQSLYDFSRSHPWPREWLYTMADAFAVEDVSMLGQSAWAQSVVADVRLQLNGIVGVLRQAMMLIEQPGGPVPYRDTLMEDMSMVLSLRDAAEEAPWEMLYEHFASMAFGKLKACRGEQYNKELQDQVKGLRDQVKKLLTAMQEELFRRPPELFLGEMQTLAPLMRTLAEFVLSFGEKYEQAKRAKGLVDFSDLEHYCLQILRHPASTLEETYPSGAALEYQTQFAEVLLDEYQDTNMVQEAIVSLISRPGAGNRFMVGDVKQSIYRFRLAEPGLFLNKYKSYPAMSKGQGLRIDLARNFRSRQEIVDAVNTIFRQIMNASVAEIDYDERAELVCGAKYPVGEEAFGQEYPAELWLIDRGNGAGTQGVEPLDDESADTEVSNGEEEGGASMHRAAQLDAEELMTAQLEARLIATQIRQLMGEYGTPFQVYDKFLKGMRSVTYRDIVILLRATQQWAPLMIEQLRLEGIPAYAELNTGYFEATEVEVMISLLKVIDNPVQDIPLAGVLRSPIVNLTAEELAQIRLHGKGLTFYEAMVKLTMEDEVRRDDLSVERGLLTKLRRFMDRLAYWRDEARQGSLSELLWRIYRETGYYDWVGGLPGGTQRQANLRALYDRARQYESTSLRGLFRFLRFIERMQDNGGDLGTARALGEQEDVVRIMTIHKSKGLEFPVVFVAGLSKMFNQQDLSASFLMHKQLGFGPRYMDQELRVAYPTLPSLAIKRQIKMELLAEEMRVLYVALTRPKEKLYLIGSVRNVEKQLQTWGQAVDQTDLLLPDYMLARGRSYLDWIAPSLMRHRDGSELRRLGGLPNRAGDCLADDPSKWYISVVPAEEVQQWAAVGLETVDQDDAYMAKLNLVRQMAEGQVAGLQSAVSNASASVSEETALQEIVDGQLELWLDEPTAEPSDVDVDSNVLIGIEAVARNLISKRLEWRYPHHLASGVAAKTTVTEMKRMLQMQEEDPAEELYQEIFTNDDEDEGQLEMRQTSEDESILSLHLRRPRFMEKKKLTPTERGTVYHLVMQHVPIGSDLGIDADGVSSLLNQMVERRLISDEQRRAVDPASVAAFYASEIGSELTAAKWVKREIPFSFGLQATEAIPHLRKMQEEAVVHPDMDRLQVEAMDLSSLDGETVLIQGVIDCLYEREDGALVLLDYKTDRIPPGEKGLMEVAERYRFQLELYKSAIERMWRRPVDALVLYFFDGCHVVHL
ncbi:helicase-exonuclease AddAB subunit AddA [Paenibacillus guangzhouensis]|uniref:helicase-exonuclease AddAB subunit AddA n=1 Tax=Paenibacillus guangzhouensis TaxID=1473112 RepID=UPI001266AC95|nr:helicase-exonuclease AddAB subunit AddA [Paenibacillus guangzhouensis]